MDIKDAIEIGADFIKTQASRALEILTKGSDFVYQIDHGSKDELKRAIMYVASLSVLGFVLAIPRLQTIGVDVDDVYLLLLDTLATVGIFFVLGAMNHVIAKVLGGAASLTSSIVITIYISTALVIVSFLFVPISAWLGALYVSESLLDVGLLVELFQSQDPAKVVVWLVVFGSSVAVAIYWLVVQAKAFRNIHGFGNLGAWTFGILSYLSYSAIATLFLLPLKKAYLHPNVLP